MSPAFIPDDLESCRDRMKSKLKFTRDRNPSCKGSTQKYSGTIKMSKIKKFSFSVCGKVFNLFYFFLFSNLVSQYALKSMKTGGMSPIETVTSNRVVLAPIITSKRNRIKTVKETISIANTENDNKPGETHTSEKIPPNKRDQKDGQQKPYKREAKSACELRRKPWYQ